MGDKEMVNDVLSMVKSSLTTYTSSISECSNQQLRQTLQQIRNSDEQFQYQLYQMAESKGFYKPATQADSNDIQQVRSAVSS
ncbi:MAG: spore coat protein [Syntrophomonadaceae bacterium]|nr:spore coat protein [Syntrophomonadaceae bacterium]MDD3270817.1 spore coat protein [Syntrophomonadaceae bacterium]MDD3897746.1 spore coat protein [Syntrophomonadaceae bacterium]MDD4562622.1 spore coat protein [Syntrophomonadaceae bacterium]